MSEHTPGPWRATNRIEGLASVVASLGRTPDDVEWYVHSDVMVLSDHLPANARLMTKAPELLEALRAAEEVLRHAGYTDTIFLARLRYLIAKAEGRPA